MVTNHDKNLKDTTEEKFMSYSFTCPLSIGRQIIYKYEKIFFIGSC